MKNLYYLKGLVVLLCTAVLSINNLSAQSVGVHGTVKDFKGEPLPGIAVVVKGTSNGVITGANGSYSISNVPAAGVLVFSSLGYVSVEEHVNSRTAIDVKIKEDNKVLDEVVVIGYGVQQKSHLTGSIAKVNTDGMADMPVSRLDQALQGKVAGLSVQNVSSEPGTAPKLSIRGMSSISAGSEPLVVVDGYPISGGMEMVNAADVASIEILKDAASAAIYGSRAAGGVIMITTKSGDSGKPSYNFKVSSGFNSTYKRVDRYSTPEYVAIMKAQKVGYDSYMQSTGSSSKLNIDNDLAMLAMGEMFGYRDWQDLGLQTANNTAIQASVSGGSEKVKYYISGNYNYDQGIMISSAYKKFNIRAKIDAKLSDRVEVGIVMTPQFTSQKRPSNSSGGWYNNLVRSGDWLPVYHTEETLKFINDQRAAQGVALLNKKPGDYTMGGDFNDLIFTLEDGTKTAKAKPWNTSDNSPISIADKTNFVRDYYSLNANSYVNVKLAKNLTFRTSNGFNFGYMNQDYFIKSDGLKSGNKATGTYNNDLNIDLLTENTLNYSNKIGKHSFSGMLGFTANLIKHRTAGIAGNFPNDYINTFNAASEIIQFNNAGDPMTETYKETTAMESFLARVTYAYDDKYLLSASWRADGSSLFGPDNRFGYFPSVSVGWRISQEPFMKNASWVDQLKLRLSYGVTGNNSIENYAAYNSLGMTNYPTGPGNGTVVPGYGSVTYTLGNRALTWEQTNEFNAGVDFAVLNGAISTTIDFYRSETKSLLLKQDIPAITGFDKCWNNIGKIRNTGLEIEINSYNFRKKDFTWRTMFNIATNSNKLLSLGGKQNETLTVGERSEGYLARVGEPAIQFYQYKSYGVYKTAAEAKASGLPTTAAAAGGLIVHDLNKNGSLDEGDREVVGTPFPDFTWGLTNTFSYKDFDFTFMFQGSQGGEMINGDVNYNENRKYVREYNFDNVWVCEGMPGDGKTPKIGAGINAMQTDYVVEDASYAALREVTLGYTLPEKYSRKIGMKALRIYASAQNLLFITGKNTRLVNPEARTRPTNAYDSPLVAGYSRGGFPMTRTISFGIDISF